MEKRRLFLNIPFRNLQSTKSKALSLKYCAILSETQPFFGAEFMLNAEKIVKFVGTRPNNEKENTISFLIELTKNSFIKFLIECCLLSVVQMHA